jgi:hypothetical protein
MHETTRLKELISRHAEEGLTPTALPGVSPLRATATTEPLGEVAEPAVAVITQGVKETALNGSVFRHGAGQFAIVPVELPVTGHITQASRGAPLLAWVLMLRQEQIAALLAELSRAATAPPRVPAEIAVSDASPALLDAIPRLHCDRSFFARLRTNEFRCSFGNRIDRCVDVGGNRRGHHRRIGDSQVAGAVYKQAGVDHGPLAGADSAGSGVVRVASDVGPDVVAQILRVPHLRPG